MTIRNQASFTASLPDWSMLKGCFPMGISPMDMDGWLERARKFLYLEHKRHGGRLLMSQDIAFHAAAELGNTALAFWCDDPLGSDITRIRRYAPGGHVEDRRAGLGDFRELASFWWQSCPVPEKRWNPA